jgi:predicted DNA-binding protein (MmcQ/YjbR family)
MMTQDEFNQFCASLPAAHHVVQWGGADVWKVGGKVFAIGGWAGGPVFGITFKTSEADYEWLRDLPGLRPAPYLASRGLKWIQRYADPGLSPEELQHSIAASYQLIVAELSRRKRAELGL